MFIILSFYHFSLFTYKIWMLFWSLVTFWSCMWLWNANGASCPYEFSSSGRTDRYSADVAVWDFSFHFVVNKSRRTRIDFKYNHEKMEIVILELYGEIRKEICYRIIFQNVMPILYWFFNVYYKIYIKKAKSTL